MIVERSVTLSFGIAFLLVFNSMIYAQSYQYYDLGVIGEGFGFAWASDVNNSGVVTLTSNVEDAGYGRACTWNNGVLANWSESIPGYWIEEFVGISETGVMAGITCNPDGGIIIDAGSATFIPIPPGCDEISDVTGISANGQYVSLDCWPPSTVDDMPSVYSVRTNKSRQIPIPDELPHDTEGGGASINNDGTMVGYFLDRVDIAYGFVYQSGATTLLDNPLGLGSNPQEVNNKGAIVGIAEDGEDYVGFQYYQGEWTVISPEAKPYALNERGDVAGGDIVGCCFQPILISDGVFRNLMEYLPSGYIDGQANGINDYRWLVGQAKDNNGFDRAWLMVPIYPKGDYDGDDDVDLHDFGHFQECYAAEPYQGTEGGLHVGCSVFDFDDDIDLDADDYAAFQGAFTGAITSGW